MQQRSPELTQAISSLIANQPFFAVLMMDLLEIQETESLPTAATDGVHLYVNPNFFRKLSNPERVFVLAHEVMHVMLQHPSRMKAYSDRGFGPDLNPFSCGKYNRAADYVINRSLNDAKVGKQPLDTLYHPDITANDLVDDIYCKLPDDPEDKNGGGGWDKHMPGDPQNSPSQASVQRAVKSAQNAAKAQGKMPAGMDRFIDEICEPQVAWADKIRKIFTAASGADQATWRRPNRRKLACPPHFYMPGRTGSASGPLAIEIDTSGSVSPEELAVFFGEIHGILNDVRPEKIYVFFVDSELYRGEVVEIDDPNDILTLQQKAGGGGGTDMEVIFRELEERQIEVQQVMVFTDGYCNFGEQRDIPTIWCITSDRVSPWGETVHVSIPKRQEL